MKKTSLFSFLLSNLLAGVLLLLTPPAQQAMAQTCATWTPRTAEASGWRSITYGNGLFVAVAFSGTNLVMTSPDGTTWTPRTAAEANSWRSVTYGNGLFVAVAFSGTNRVMTSPDGITWTPRTAAEANQWNSVTYANGLFVAVASSGTNRVMTSPDGITWTPQTAAEVNQWLSVTYGIAGGNPLFVAVATDGTNRVMTSPDGTTWTPRTAAQANGWYSVTYGNGLFVAVAYDGTNRVMTSPNGTTWTPRTAAQANEWYGVTYGNGLFVAVSGDGTNRVMTSPDGTTWTACPAAQANPWLSVTYGMAGGNPLFVAVAVNGTNRVMTSGTFTPVCSLTVAIAPSSQTITAGSSATLTASGATSYTWSNGSTANPLVLTNVTSATALSVTGVTGTCSATATAAVSVTADPCVFVPKNITVSGTTANGTYAPDGTYNGAPMWTWTAYSAYRIWWTGTRWEVYSYSSPSYNFVTATNSTGSITYLPATGWVAAQAQYGTPVLSGGFGSLVGGPSITPSSSTITAGGSLTLTASGSDTYTWSNGQTGASIVVSPTSTTALSVTGVAGACIATASATVSVTVNPCVLPNLTVSGVSDLPVQNGVYLPSGTLNGAPAWVKGTLTVYWTGTWWRIRDLNSQKIYATSQAGSASSFPCTGWYGSEEGGDSPTVSGFCGSWASYPLVSIAATPSLTITSGQSATLTASGATSYTWSTGATTSSIATTAAGTYSVRGVTGTCSATATTTLTNSVDLTPTLYLPSANFTPSGPNATRNLTMGVYEGSGLPTAAGAVIVTISVPLGYTLTFDNTLTATSVTGGTNNPVAVNNSQWTLTSSSDTQITLTMKSGQAILASGNTILGLSLTRNGASKGTANLTVNVNDDAARVYDSNPANNVFAISINTL